MSRTLFWYVFKDLLRVFLLTSVALAGIMSFAGLLRPLTKHGLDGGQVLRMLAFFMPGMATYSLPVAAVFAATMVYGRLSADNEVTACRAAGISNWTLSLPALMVGLCVTLVSLLLLSFIVPAAMLEVERVIYSNLAQLVANRIERTHTIEFGQDDARISVWAQSARVLDPPAGSSDQVVQLSNVVIATHERVGRGQARMDVPVDYYLARAATAFIRMGRGNEPVLLRVALDGGTKFSRTTTGRASDPFDVSVGATQFGPWPLPSPVRENSRFMSIRTLQHLLRFPEESRKIGRLVNDFIRAEMREQYLRRLRLTLNESSDRVVLDAGAERYVLNRSTVPAEIVGERLVLDSPPGTQQVGFQQLKSDGSGLAASAAQASLRAWPDLEDRTLTLTIELRGATVTVDGRPSPRGDGFQRTLVVPMPEAVAELRHRRAEDYAVGSVGAGSADRRRVLYRDKLEQYNSFMSEIHARLSFSLSSLVLVLVGASLGQMFRSGHFLSAFAVSVVPAMVSILLVVSGQHTAENIPWDYTPERGDPLRLGLALIWSGNGVVAALAGWLLWKLGRQ